MWYFYILLFVQVVAEGFPVSSSAHIQLLKNYFCGIGWDLLLFPVGSSEMLVTTALFDTVIHLMHLPTLLIVAIFFRDRWIFLCMALRRCWRIVVKLICLTAIADSVTLIFFIFLKLFPIPLPLGIGFCITAFVLYSLRWCQPSNKIWNWRYALALGAVQGIALLPGISRFALVYASACLLGLSQRKAFEITWLVQWPLILAACVKSLYILWVGGQLVYILEPYTLFMTSIATACGLSMFYVAAYMAREGLLWWFSFYMIIPTLAWFYLCVM